jgi:hypothetical protein
VIRNTIATLALLASSSLAVYAQSPKAPQAGEKKTPPAAEQKAPPPTEQQTKSLNLTAYAELLRSDIRTQKVAIITQVMGFTEAEEKAFWPIYRQYDAEMAKLGDERVALIEEYARNYDKMTDEIADKLATKALDLEARRQALKGKCFEQVKKALSPRTAMRFLQVEHQLQLLIDLQIASSLPIASSTSDK